MQAGPYGIEQVDVPGILNAYQAQQDRRVNQMLLQRKIAQEDRELQKQEKLAGIYKNLHAPGTPLSVPSQPKGGDPASGGGGIAGAYQAPPAPPSDGPTIIPTGRPLDPNMPTGSPLSPATFPQDTAPVNGAVTTPAPNEAPATPSASPAAVQSWYEANRGVVDQLVTVDPAQAFELATRLQTMDSAQEKKAESAAGAFSVAAEHLSSFPSLQARQAELQRIKPDLVQAGIPAAQIDGFSPTDSNLQWLYMRGSDMKTILGRIKDDRDFSETQRHHMAEEGAASGNLAVRQSALGLARQREGRVAKGSNGGDLSGLSTGDLIRMAGGN